MHLQFHTKKLIHGNYEISNKNSIHWTDAVAALQNKISRRLCKFPVDFQDFQEC